MGEAMRKKGFKGRCEKRMLGKSEAVCRLYDPIQSAYADRLQEDDAIREFQCNVLLDDGEHMTDFLCIRRWKRKSRRQLPSAFNVYRMFLTAFFRSSSSRTAICMLAFFCCLRKLMR